MIIQVLLTLQTMATNRHAVVGGINDIGILNLTHGLEFLEHASNLNIDIFTAGELPADFVTDRPFIAPLPNALDPHFIAYRRVTVIKGVFR